MFTEDKGFVVHFEYHPNNQAITFVCLLTCRLGDSSRSVSAICFTIPGTADGSSLTGLESGSDFKTRGMDSEFRVVFPAGINKASCDVKVRIFPVTQPRSET